MRRLVMMWLITILTVPVCLRAQTTSQPAPTSDPQAVSLAQQSIAALTGGNAISDVTLNTNVTSIAAANNANGTGVFKAKGWNESLVSITLPSGTRSEARNDLNGFPAGAWSLNGNPSTAMAQHNAWTDASWFFPALSSLSQTANSQCVFNYIGEEQHNSVTVQHIRASQLAPSGLTNSPIPTLSTIDFYLDPTTLLPQAIDFTLHDDNNTETNIPVEIRFASYQTVNGIQVPFHFQRLMNGTLMVDAKVTSAAFNTGLQDSIFTLP